MWALTCRTSSFHNRDNSCMCTPKFTSSRYLPHHPYGDLLHLLIIHYWCTLWCDQAAYCSVEGMLGCVVVVAWPKGVWLKKAPPVRPTLTKISPLPFSVALSFPSCGSRPTPLVTLLHPLASASVGQKWSSPLHDGSQFNTFLCRGSTQQLAAHHTEATYDAPAIATAIRYPPPLFVTGEGIGCPDGGFKATDFGLERQGHGSGFTRPSHQTP